VYPLAYFLIISGFCGSDACIKYTFFCRERTVYFARKITRDQRFSEYAPEVTEIKKALRYGRLFSDPAGAVNVY